MDYELIVVGGGAAGIFGAIQVAEMRPGTKILVVEKSPKLLSKVRISGGGRCNVTHSCFEPTALSKHYPRGSRILKTLFRRYQASDVVRWFEEHGVALKTEEDGRMFPASDDSQTIINCFMEQVERRRIRIEAGNGASGFKRTDTGFSLTLQDGRELSAQHLLIATGGNASPDFYRWLSDRQIPVAPPIPSLFTFNDPSKRFANLMGVAVPNAEVRIAGTRHTSSGAVLITHWGLSGPAIIRLSAWAAEYLHTVGYTFTTLVSWIGPARESEIRTLLESQRDVRKKQKIQSHALFNLPQRLWVQLCTLSGIEEQRIWAELPGKNLNRLLENLIRCPVEIKGKTTFKEEFVTCGGVGLQEVDPESMQSNSYPGLFFAGEVLNIDGETGGFNFQAAWTTAHIAAKAIALSLSRGTGEKLT